MGKDRVLRDIGTIEQLDEEWQSIDWQSVDKRVRNLRRRIFRAIKDGQWNQARSLMKLMLHSRSNLLQSVRKVTQQNRGKKTPGIDKQVVSTPSGRMKLTHSMLKHEAWKVNPARRVYIPKADGKQRPLGILTIKNRVAQAMVKNALEPVWEAQFEQHSYGFRPGRSAHDAIAQCFNRLQGVKRDHWVLDADIKAAFDNIDHDFIMKRIGLLPGRELVKQWLAAGYVEADVFNATESGVPQGGVISPLLANIAMDGLEALVGKCGFIRYADDFVITARSKEQLLEVLPKIEEFLLERGLRLNAEKTQIRSIKDGFDFLGFNLRRYGTKCLIKPQKKKVLSMLQEIRNWLSKNQATEAGNVIRFLNPRIDGWANYYRHVVSKAVFNYVDHQIFRAIWSWCKRRHPTKSRSWIANKYFGICKGNRTWLFHGVAKDSDGNLRKLVLKRIQEKPIKRHIKVSGKACPDDGELVEYWRARELRLSNRHVQVRGEWAPSTV